MNQLVKTPSEKEALESLTDIQQYYVRLKSEKPISQLADTVIKSACLEIVTAAMVEQSPNGQADPKVLQFQAGELFKELNGKFKSLTLSEVKEAFKLGIRGETGPYFGMCAKTYHQFIKHWFDRQERGKAWDVYLDKLAGWKRAEKPSLSPEWFYEACEKAYQDYKQKGELPISPFGYYDFIKQYLQVETLIEKEKWPQIKNEANMEYRAKVKGLEIAKEWTLDPEVNLVYGNCIKNIAVKYFFDKLILDGKEKIK